MTASPAKPTSGTSRVDFHKGNMMIWVAETYPSLLKSLLEIIQNSLDSMARNIKVKVDLKDRTISVSDDGKGASQEKFGMALQQIGKSMKEVNEDVFGRYGRGLVAPITKCDTYLFTSVPEGQESEGYIRWTFKEDEIRHMDEASIPFVHCQDIYHESVHLSPTKAKGKQPIWWRTQAKLVGITRDRVITNFTENDLHHHLDVQFGMIIRKRKVNITTRFTDEKGKTTAERNVVASEFSGTTLPLYEDTQESSGKTTFQLYLARLTSTGRKGQVKFGVAGNPFNLTARQLASCSNELLDAEVAEAIQSGIFEGRIVCEKVTLNPDRVRFDNNDALFGLCVSIENWFAAQGRKQMLEVMEENRESRWKAIGLRAMEYVKELMQQDGFKDLMSRFKIGNLETEETIEGDTEVVTEKEIKKPNSTTESTPDTPKEPGGTKAPGTSGGPTNPPRIRRRSTEVKSSAIGLRFVCEDFETTRIPFDFDTSRGIIRYNTRHPNWQRCEDGNTALMKYYEAVAQLALTLIRNEKSAAFDHLQAMAYEILDTQVFAILNADRLTGRRAGAKKTPK